MEWLKENYERALAASAGFFLFLCLVFIFFGAENFRDRRRSLQSTPPPNDTIPSGKSIEVAEAVQKLVEPAQWKMKSLSGLFVPEKYFIGPNGEPTALQNALLHPPVPNAWLEEYSLPITESDVLAQDPDGDGFTNRDEWDGHTNPIDRDSHPPYVSKLRLRSASEEAFPLLFSSSMADVYAINNLDRTKPTQFLRIGDVVRGTKYKLAGYREKHATNKYGTTLDESELTLEEIDTHDLVRLIKEKPAISPKSVANFIYAWGGTEQNFSAKKDQEFILKPAETVKYRLKEVWSEKAVIVLVTKPEEEIAIDPAGRPAQLPGR